MTKVFKTVSDWLQFRDLTTNTTIGLIPTMGALHEGHLSLMERSLSDNDLTIVSLFVNPTQFNNPSDLSKYPRTFDKDLELIQNLGVPLLFAPNVNELYPDNYQYKVTENTESRLLCGAHRPGHFDGVLTIVIKLLNLVRPQKAYFGEKDFQQLKLIEGMVNALFIPTKIISCPTIRETDGLAMSSRNVRLDPQQRTQAPLFQQILRAAPSKEEAIQQLQNAGFEVDYVEDHYNRRLGAVRIGPVRLIDNVQR